MRIDDFIFLYRTLNKENDWVKLSTIIPWDKVEDIYATMQKVKRSFVRFAQNPI